MPCTVNTVDTDDLYFVMNQVRFAGYSENYGWHPQICSLDKFPLVRLLAPGAVPWSWLDWAPARGPAVEARRPRVTKAETRHHSDVVHTAYLHIGGKNADSSGRMQPIVA